MGCCRGELGGTGFRRRSVCSPLGPRIDVWNQISRGKWRAADRFDRAPEPGPTSGLQD